MTTPTPQAVVETFFHRIATSEAVTIRGLGQMLNSLP